MKKIIILLILFTGIKTNAQLKEHNQWYNDEVHSIISDKTITTNYILINNVISSPTNETEYNWENSFIEILMLDEGIGKGFSMYFMLDGKALNISNYFESIVDIDTNIDISIGSFIFKGKDIHVSVLFSRVSKGLIHIKENDDVNLKFINYLRSQKGEVCAFIFEPTSELDKTIAFQMKTNSH